MNSSELAAGLYSHFKLSRCRAACGRWGHRPRRAAPVGVPPTGYKNSSKLAAGLYFLIEIKYSKRRNKTVFYFDLATFA
jgi:hypothetical protein